MGVYVCIYIGMRLYVDGYRYPYGGGVHGRQWLRDIRERQYAMSALAKMALTGGDSVVIWWATDQDVKRMEKAAQPWAPENGRVFVMEGSREQQQQQPSILVQAVGNCQVTPNEYRYILTVGRAGASNRTYRTIGSCGWSDVNSVPRLQAGSRGGCV